MKTCKPLVSRSEVALKAVNTAPGVISVRSKGQSRVTSLDSNYYLSHGAIQEMAHIRTHLKEAKIVCDWYPFKSSIKGNLYSDQKYPWLKHVEDRGYHLVEDAVSVREALDEAVKLVPMEKRCCNCGTIGELPTRLVESGYDETKVVCWSCGLKYLANYTNYCANEPWFYFDGFKVEDVI
jgi:hypothetical protein